MLHDARSRHATALLNLIAARGVVRSMDLLELGIPRSTLQRLERHGQVAKLGRGLYALAGAELGQGASLAAVARRVPGSVVCLLSALRFHAMGTENPPEVWLAVDRKARRPAIAGLALRVVRFSATLLTEGTAVHILENVPVRITTPARTVADCFKYRNKLGMDVALAALQSYIGGRMGDLDDLWRQAVLCRVANVMRPYLEAMA